MNEQMNPRNQSHPRNHLLFITAASMQPVLIHHSCIHAACLPRIHWGNIAACLLVEHRSLSSTHPLGEHRSLSPRGTSQLVFHASTGGTSQLVFSWNITACLPRIHWGHTSTQPVVIHHSVLNATSCYSSQLYPRNQLLFIPTSNS